MKKVQNIISETKLQLQNRNYFSTPLFQPNWIITIKFVGEEKQSTVRQFSKPL